MGLNNTLRGLEKFFQGCTATSYWIGYSQGVPFAFLITAPAEGDAITLDLFICDLNYLGKGLAVPMMHAFLVGHFPHVKRVLIDPEATNARAIHVYQKAGFKIEGEFIASWHPVPHYQMNLDMKDLLGPLMKTYPGYVPNIKRCIELGFPWKSRPLLKAVEGQIVSHAGLLDYPLWIDGKEHQAAALHAIYTHAPYRRRGYATELIQEAVKTQDLVVLFTEIPSFYEKLGFKHVQEYRFRFTCKPTRGSQSLSEVDKALFLRRYRERTPLSNKLWMKDDGSITAFNTLFATAPVFWSLSYSAPLDAILSFELKDKTLHLYDVVAKKMPSLENILDHFSGIEEVYFYFSPDLLTPEAQPEPHLYDKGHLMVKGDLTQVNPFMIPPLSRC